MQPIGISVHIGVNRLERSRYPGVCPLQGCENDARAMRRLAAAQGFEPTLLLDPQATVAGVETALTSAAEAVGSDGILLVTYAGHGGRVRDTGDDETDRRDVVEGYDETWCLHDRQMLDDELYRLWSRFRPGARILVVSDSCNSGTVIRGSKGFRPPRPRRSSLRDGARSTQRVRALTSREAAAAFDANRTEYERVRGELREQPRGEVKASVLLLSATQEAEVAAEGDEHGAFTAALLAVWADGAFQGSHKDFHAAIYRRLQGRQQPGYDWAGALNPGFEGQRPFTI